MKRVMAMLAGLGLALLGFTGAAAAAAPRAQLARYACVRALDPAQRSISVQAVMRPLDRTRRLQVKFDLLERSGGSAGGVPQAGVRAGDLGTWISPADPTLGQRAGDVWRVNKTVLNLGAPALYRLRVSFRWTDAAGRVVGIAVRRTPVCRQPELRPDLVVESLTVTPVPNHPGSDVYVATIADDGATGAGPFEVLFAPGGGAPPVVRTVAFLRAHGSRQMTFEGAACDPADPPTVKVDAAAEIDDFNRANNQMTAVCPAGS